MTLRVMTFNILNGGGERMPVIRDVIRSQYPDIVAIQEANDRGLIESLARELEMSLIFGEANSPYHLAWLTRAPILRSANHKLPELRKTLLELVVEWEGMPLQLFNIHLRPEPEAEGQRLIEIQAALHAMGPLEATPRLFVGDFNALAAHDQFVSDIKYRDEDVDFAERAYPLPRSVIPAIIAAGYVDVYRSMNPGAEGYTNQTPTPVTRIDYIFASPSLAARAISCDLVTGALAVYASDHLPVRAEFE